MTPSNKEISQQFSQGNFSFCYEYFADNVEWRIIGSNSVKGKEAVIQYCDKMLIEMASGTLNNTNVIANDNDIAIEGNCTYTDTHNNLSEVLYCDVYHFENDKIANIVSYCIEKKV